MIMKQTQMSSILEYLENGNSITSMQAFQMFGCTRLSAKIFDMRKRGMNIKTETITCVNRYGMKTQCARYTLVK